MSGAQPLPSFFLLSSPSVFLYYFEPTVAELAALALYCLPLRSMRSLLRLGQVRLG